MGHSRTSETWKRRWLLPAGVLVLGLALGFAGKRALVRGGSKDRGLVQEARLETKSAREIVAVPVSTLRSNDSIEEIVADGSAQQYGRLALWVLDATAEEMKAMFFRLLEEEGIDRWTFDLLMVQWTQVDPWAAIEASRDTPHASKAWWAWGKCDPTAALAAAAQEAPRWLGVVMRGAGQSHPELALQLLEQYPEARGYISIHGIAEGLSESDPEAAVEFGRRHGKDIESVTEGWARREPEKFLQWCTELPATRFLGWSLQRTMQALVREHPERLGELAQALPPGQVRRELLQTAMKELARTDVDRALALVREQSGDLAQRELYAELGEQLVEVDVERSMELFREVAHLRLSGPREWRTIPNGYAGGDGAFDSWMERLGRERPHEAMALAREVHVPGERSLEWVASRAWMESDAVEFGEWLADEPPGMTRDRHAADFTKHLAREAAPDLVAATAWAVSVEREHFRNDAMQVVIDGWRRHATAAEAEEYFQSQEAPPVAREAWDRWREQNEQQWARWQAGEEER